MRFIAITSLLIYLFTVDLNAQSIQTIRVDPTYARGGKASQFFDSIRFIPLETNKESLFGKIDQLIVTDSFYIVLDNSGTRSILIFDRDGKYHAKIKIRSATVNKQNKSYDGYIFGFDVDRQKRQIILRASIGDKSDYAYYYNYEGKKIAEKKTNNYYSDTYSFPGDLMVVRNFRPYSQNKDSIVHEITYYRGDKVLREYFPYNQKTTKPGAYDYLNSPRNSFYPTSIDTLALMTRLYNDTAYAVSPHAFLPRFRFVFPMDNTLPQNFTTDSSLDNKRVQYLIDHKNLIYGVTPIYLIGNNLFFHLRNWYGIQHNDSFIFNLTSGSLIALDHLNADSSTSYLPITDDAFWTDFENTDFLTYYKDKLYTSYSAMVLFQVMEMNRDKHPVYSDALQKYFANQNRKSNPIIIELKPKANF